MGDAKCTERKDRPGKFRNTTRQPVPRLMWDDCELTSVAFTKPTWVKISQIRTLSVERLGRRLGHVSDDEMSQVLEGLNEIIGEQSAAGYRP